MTDLLPAVIETPTRYVIVESTTGLTHVHQFDDSTTVFQRFTLCGSSILGWKRMFEIWPGEDATGAVECRKCHLAWSKKLP